MKKILDNWIYPLTQRHTNQAFSKFSEYFEEIKMKSNSESILPSDINTTFKPRLDAVIAEYNR